MGIQPLLEWAICKSRRSLSALWDDRRGCVLLHQDWQSMSAFSIQAVRTSGLNGFMRRHIGSMDSKFASSPGFMWAVIKMIGTDHCFERRDRNKLIPLIPGRRM